MDSSYRVSNSSTLFSPALLFYQNKILANTKTVLAQAGDPLRVRPHVKTHKTREICQLQMELGIRKFKTATIAEAEMAALAGAPDVLLAYPLVGPQQHRFLALQQEYPAIRFSALFDDLDQATVLAARAEASGTTVTLFMDLDPGLHRTGIPLDSAFDLYEKASRLPGLHLEGLHAYDGQNHQSDLQERNRAAHKIHREVLDLQVRLHQHGLSAPTVVLGGTPTYPIYLHLGDVEVSPGTCFLHDWGYMSQFPDEIFEPAALVFTRVVSRHPDQNTFTLDLGHKALAADPPGAKGILFDREPDFAVPLFQNEEHWVFQVKNGTLPRIGDEFYVLPTHICPTSALHARAHVVDQTGVWVTDWDIIGRNRELSL